ncbi:MAG: hypothetical protein U5K54_25200 [Cytophagales bacterium]|nr:hypothetical protein [Cytophagales bacterium]
MSKTGQKEKAFAYLKLYRAFKDENDRLNNIAQRSELEIHAVLKKRQREDRAY